MLFQNFTPYDALDYEMLDQFDTAFHVVVCKTAYQLLPAEADEAENAGNAGKFAAAGLRPLLPPDPAALLCDQDQYAGAMNASTVIRESDLAPYKPRCDVIVHGHAHAPQGVPVWQFQVRLQVLPAALPGTASQADALIDKTLCIDAPRVLVPDGVGVSGGSVGNGWHEQRRGNITQLALEWEAACGGQCRVNQGEPDGQTLLRNIRDAGGAGGAGEWAAFCLSEDERASHPDAERPLAEQALAHRVNETNPIGSGWAEPWFLRLKQPAAWPLPAIHYPNDRLDAERFAAALAGLRDWPAPAGTACVGRAWQPRRNQIGPVEQKPHYASGEYPRLPESFDFGYWNSAPRDQQCAHLQGGETLLLHNLCAPDARFARTDAQGNTVLRLTLPGLRPYLLVSDSAARLGVRPLIIDTVWLAPDLARLELTWRALIPTAVQPEQCSLYAANTEQQHADLADLLQRSRHGA